MESSGKRHLFDDARNVKRIIRLLFACCAVLLASDFVIHRHLSFGEGLLDSEGWYGFYPVYGFVACVLLVLAARQMRKFLMRGEDHYER